MEKISILDCTLRDGGYVNNWNFRYKNIVKILENLTLAKIDYIECGFFKPIEYNPENSLFSSISDLAKIVGNNKNTIYTLMINFGEYDISMIPECTNDNIAIRVAFKKDKMYEAIEYCKQLKDKKYKVFVNPMHTKIYSYSELLELVDMVNKFSPYALTIVDTTGAMKENDILSLFYLIDNNLDKNISLAFHSHNNLQLSFSNAQCLMKVNKNRNLIIDSTVFGIGRGAGNLCTELLTQYINDNYNGSYNILPILKIIDEQINPIYAKTPWGYSVPYYLAATNNCHPNYAKYLNDKQTVPVEMVNELLKKIPDGKKASYDANLIKQLYLDNFSNVIDDSETIEHLKEKLSGKNLLLLAPGKTLSTEQAKIKEFISANNPYIISLNFAPEAFDYDMAFITNIKRYAEIGCTSKEIIATSNIENLTSDTRVLNYSSYINQSDMFDNVTLIMLEVLSRIGVKKVYFAGLDGFSPVMTQNYASDDLINNSKIDDAEKKNSVMSEELSKYAKEIDLEFITETMYKLSNKPEKVNV